MAAPLTVVSCNIRNGIALDGRHSWPFRRALLARVLASTGADVIGLQEVYRFQRRYLERRLPGYDAAGRGRDDGVKGEQCTLLAAKPRVRIDAWLVRWLSDTPDVPGSRWLPAVARVATIARCTDLETGEAFRVANTHLDTSEEWRRDRSAALLVDWLAADDVPTILLGDLNTLADGPAIRTLLGAGFVDCFAHLPPEGPGTGTHHSWTGRTDTSRIDYILVKGPWEVVDAAILHGRPGDRLPSDHWPIRARLLLG